ncbi:MAG: CaiB/BaiF CoA transferase family protein [Dehalococcoidia bacterium]
MMLQGIRVLDLSQFIFVPYCCVHLADLGAEVIKIENPNTGGDPNRGMMGGHLPDAGFNYGFEQNNRSKKSIAVDLSHQEEKEVIHKLVAVSDVFVTNFQVLTLKRLGMDYESLTRFNPALIYALGTGYGLNGPDKDRGAFDYGVFARSGMMSTFGEPDSPLCQCQPGMGDHAAAMSLAFGIMAALFHRQRTGEGQLVETSLLGGLLDIGGLSLQAALATGEDIPRRDRKSTGNPLCNSYATKDGEWLQLASKQSDRNWPDFCRALGIEHLQNDPRFEDHVKRSENAAELIAILDKIFAGATLDEWAQRFEGLNVHWSPVYTYSQVAADPQAWENGYIVETEHPQLGSLKVVGLPVAFSKTPPLVRSGAPELGQHTEQIMLDIGYSWDDITRLKDQNVII